MRSLLGTFALAGGLSAAVSATGWWVFAARGRAHAEPRARLMTWVMLASSAAACLVLVEALVSHDFSVRYVAENGARSVPLYYTIISLWAALEGSLLLWLFVLSAVMVLAMRAPHPRGAHLRPWAMATVGAVAIFFFSLAMFAGNAFDVVSPVPPDGPGPNPLLQDHPLMGAHPPLLYIGYVSLTIPFAYAVAALITGATGPAWVIVTRRWTLVAWTALTVGVMLGGWWSYEVLGWGGYWAWDPVENAAIVPWFTATALLHSVMVQERRATLRVWNLSLAVGTFLLMLVGTFLTRSGVIGSVHAFSQSAVGPLLLGFIIVVVVAVGALFVWRSDRLGPDRGLDGALSREAVFLANNVVLVGLALTVLIGTVFPLALEAVNGQRVSVGAPYFNRMSVPLALVMVLLMGVGPLVPWGLAQPAVLARRLAWPAVIGLATMAVLGLAGARGPLALVTFGLSAFVAATIAVQFAEGASAARRATGAGWLRALPAAILRRRRLYGGLVVHLGVVTAAVAIAASQAYSQQSQQLLSVGESFAVGGYTARLVGIDDRRSPRMASVVARVELARGARSFGVHEPRLNRYPGASSAVGTPSVQTGAKEDAYLILAGVNASRSQATIRLSINPGIVWLWISAGVMAGGALLAGLPSRRRTTFPAQTQARVGEAPAEVPV